MYCDKLEKGIREIDSLLRERNSMKVVMINGQKHKGSTYHIGKILSEKITQENEITEFFLPKDLNHFCTGCLACIQDESKCPFYNQKKVIMDAMEEAEILILTTPTYCMAPSAPMKAFIDLFYQYWIPHRPRKSMFLKKAIVVSTAAGAGMSKAIEPVKRTLKYWGVPNVYTYALGIQAGNWEEVSEKNKIKIEKDMKRLSEKVKDSKVKQPSLYIKFMFNLMVKAKQKEDYFSDESKHWKEQGWLDSKKPWR